MTRYEALTPETLPARLGGLDAVAKAVGGAPADWRVQEVGDGNLNLVFIVEGTAGSVIVKQALPYVRLVGESWPLPLKPRLLRIPRADPAGGARSGRRAAASCISTRTRR